MKESLPEEKSLERGVVCVTLVQAEGKDRRIWTLVCKQWGTIKEFKASK